jgi:hypothetical protein
MPPEPDTHSFQVRYAQRWSHLHHPHVRALAWLLDAPDLLDAGAAIWQGKVATLGVDCATDAADWLAGLEAEPAALEAWLGATPYTRLGRYAEKLMAFYFEQHDMLVAHGVQVRASKNLTVGEFDFLLRDGEHLLHWEFATKFYLLEASGEGHHSDYFVGPNLADTLGAKMTKIFDRQLMLAAHPAAQPYLSQPVSAARALIKGWLFYHLGDPEPCADIGLDPHHCRGFWCALAELPSQPGQVCVILKRIEWLAPARIAAGEGMTVETLRAQLSAYFEHDTMPVMVAMLSLQGAELIETSRGFIVPDDWRERAGKRIALA